MPKELFTLFLEQSRYICRRPYKNEFETMCLLLEKLPEKNSEIIKNLSLDWIQDLEKYENMEYDLKDVSEKVKESNNLRQEGNQLFTGSGNKRNILGACSLYNDAIDAALDTNDEELALCFANRGVALQAFGYYQQAYDDCVWALKLGYPVTMHHKIVLRQAFCAIKLEDVQKAETHIRELKQMDLNSNCLKQYNNLEAELQILRQKQVEGKIDINIKTDIPLHRESQEIIYTAEKGRCMIAKCDIAKDQLIFTERIPAAVPIGDVRRVCQQCLKVNFIPYPCLKCRGRVNYCSIKCQNEHAHIHLYECRAYRFQLFAQVGIAHLALRILLDNGIFPLAEEIKDIDKCTAQVWYDMLEYGNIPNNNNVSAYVESLKMMTHLDKMSDEDRMWFALVSVILVVYLKHYTDYFKELNEKNDKINWEILTGSLILRHIGQSITNGFNLTAVIAPQVAYLSNSDYVMLNDKIWSSPWHLKLGFLNQFSNYDIVAAVNLPYTSLCNHSCVQSIQTRFSGRYFSTYALRNFSKGDEITNCYEADYRKFKRSARREKLRETYFFDCKCEDCVQPAAEDAVFEKFHQYRCDNQKCGKIFVPNLPEKPTLNWWQFEKSNGHIDLNVYCTVCGSPQSFSWYHELKQLFSSVNDPNTRRRQFNIFKKMGNTLIGLNDARGFFGMKMVDEWFKLPLVNIYLNDQDYKELVEITKYLEKLFAAEFQDHSVEYLVVLTYLWDLIALRKHKCPTAEMDRMLHAIKILDDDTTQIFLNYYNDYIKNTYVC